MTKFASAELPTWVETGDVVRGWPVLQDPATKRLYVGECLRTVNPSGAGGRVWSAKDLDALKHNVEFKYHERETEN